MVVDSATDKMHFESEDDLDFGPVLVNDDESVNEYSRRFYGHDDIVLNIEMLIGLLEGKYICFNNSEYSACISIDEECYSLASSLVFLKRNKDFIIMNLKEISLELKNIACANALDENSIIKEDAITVCNSSIELNSIVKLIEKI